MMLILMKKLEEFVIMIDNEKSNVHYTVNNNRNCADNNLNVEEKINEKKSNVHINSEIEKARNIEEKKCHGNEEN